LAAGDALGALFGRAVAGDGRQVLRVSHGLLPMILVASLDGALKETQGRPKVSLNPLGA
jgi:hypothetical protein